MSDLKPRRTRVTRTIVTPQFDVQDGPRGPYTQANCGACRMDAPGELSVTRVVLYYVGRYPEGHVYLGRCSHCASEVKRTFAEVV